jgi:hypothetical protein
MINSSLGMLVILMFARIILLNFYYCFHLVVIELKFLEENNALVLEVLKHLYICMRCSSLMDLWKNEFLID